MLSSMVILVVIGQHKTIVYWQGLLLNNFCSHNQVQGFNMLNLYINKPLQHNVVLLCNRSINNKNISGESLKIGNHLKISLKPDRCHTKNLLITIMWAPHYTRLDDTPVNSNNEWYPKAYIPYRWSVCGYTSTCCQNFDHFN